MPLGGSDQIVQEPGSLFPGRDVLMFRPLIDGVPQDSEGNAPQLPGRPEELFDGGFGESS